MIRRLWNLPWRWILPGCGLLLALTAVWLLFPQPDRSIWPPSARDDRNVVYVSIGPLHAAIDLPDYTTGLFEEWHMGARTWYIDHRRSWRDIVKGIFTSDQAIIRVGMFAFARWERNDLPPNSVFKFWLSEEGRRRLLARLHRDRGGEISRADGFVYFDHRGRYSLLANCNGFIGGALEAAGLPIREIASVEPHLMRWQLRRCLSFQEDGGTIASAAGGPGSPTGGLASGPLAPASATLVTVSMPLASTTSAPASAPVVSASTTVAPLSGTAPGTR